MIPIAIASVFALIFFAVTTQAANAPGETETEGYKKFGSAWRKYDGYFQAAAIQYGVPLRWLKGIAIVESSLGTDPRVVSGGVSSDGKSWGLMQFTLPTARDFDPSATPEKLNNAAYSVDLAGKLLKHLKSEFKDDERKIIMSYNQGEGATKKGRTFAAGYYGKWLEAARLIEGG